MLDFAPAIDLAEHRSAERVGRAQPVAQRLHRTKAGATTAIRGNGKTARWCRLPVGGFVGGRIWQTQGHPLRGEAELLDSEAEQGSLGYVGAAEGGGQQQQGAIAQSRGVAWTGGG